MNRPVPEDFSSVQRLYDDDMADNVRVHDLIYPEVFGAAEYIGQFSDNSAAELLSMARAMALPAKAQVLDVGCGRGRVAAFFARTLGWVVTGIDLAEVPLADARATATGRGAPVFIRGNVYEHRFPSPLDGAYGTGSFCHFDAERLFGRLRALIAPQGVLAFMERVRLREIPAPTWDRLTRAWHCPSVYTVDEYHDLLRTAGFGAVTATDLTPSFRVWQKRSVEARLKLRERIISLSSRKYFDTSLQLAGFETDATESGLLGYALVVARGEPCAPSTAARNMV